MGPGASERYRNSKVQLFSRLKPRNIFPGEWESIYTGEGIEFAAIKPYEPGDDLRDLDLQTLVQSGEEEIVQRIVGRQRHIFVWIDLSGSMRRFPQMLFARKTEIRDLAVGLIAFSAWNAYTPVGLCAFDQEIRQFMSARSGASHCEEIVGWFLDHADECPPAHANIPGALAFLEQVSPQSMIFFISDFQDPVFDGDFAPLLRVAANRFDFIPVVIRDPLERAASLTHSAVIRVRDSEGKRAGEIEFSPRALAEIQRACSAHLAHLEQRFRAVGLDYILLDSDSIQDCYQTLSGFFEARKRTRG
jgi:uncharacterized protein (DUF58 family)